MELNNKYGYKVLYRELGKKKLKVYLVCNTFDGAVWNVRWYERNEFYDKNDNHLLVRPTWHIEKIKNIKEYNKLWKGCPFKDDLS